MSKAQAVQQPPVQALLREIVDLDIDFRERIAEGDWASATRLHSERRQALETLFQQPMQPAERRQVTDTLQALRQSDQALVKSLEEARDHCSAQITRMRLGRQATSSYESTGLMVSGPKMMQ